MSTLATQLSLFNFESLLIAVKRAPVISTKRAMVSGRCNTRAAPLGPTRSASAECKRAYSLRCHAGFVIGLQHMCLVYNFFAFLVHFRLTFLRPPSIEECALSGSTSASEFDFTAEAYECLGVFVIVIPDSRNPSGDLIRVKPLVINS